MQQDRPTLQGALMLLLAGALLLAPQFDALAVEYVVPDDPGCETIMACIQQAAYQGDTIRVRPGSYPGAVWFMGKSVCLKSEEGPEGTVIEGAGSSPSVSFVMGEGRGAVLHGFTLTRGIAIADSSPTIVENVLTGGAAWQGAAVYIEGPAAAPLIESNRFEFLEASAGVLSYYGSPGVSNNTFEYLWTVSGEYAAAITIYWPQLSEPLRIRGNRISNCQTYGPFAGIVVAGGYRKRGGLAGRTPDLVLVEENTITDNQALAFHYGSASIHAILVVDVQDVAVLSNRVQGNHGNALSHDPAMIYGIQLLGFDEAVAANNLVAANWAEGMTTGSSVGMAMSGGDNALVAQNTVAGNYGVDGFEAGHSAGMELGPLAGNLWVLNNIVADNAPPAGYPGGPGRGLAVEQATGLLADWNDVTGHDEDYLGLEAGPDDLSVDPLFVNPGAGDYHLQASSPCVDRGTDLPIPIDLEGDPRPIGLGFDMGSDEVADPCPGAPGDVNDDGVIGQADALLAFEFALGIQTPGPCEFRRADVVVDGMVTTGDSLCIFRFVNGLSSCLD